MKTNDGTPRLEIDCVPSVCHGMMMMMNIDDDDDDDDLHSSYHLHGKTAERADMHGT